MKIIYVGKSFNIYSLMELGNLQQGQYEQISFLSCKIESNLK